MINDSVVVLGAAPTRLSKPAWYAIVKMVVVCVDDFTRRKAGYGFAGKVRWKKGIREYW